MPTNTPSYTICSALIVYIFVNILIETRIAPLRNFHKDTSISVAYFENLSTKGPSLK